MFSRVFKTIKFVFGVSLFLGANAGVYTNQCIQKWSNSCIPYSIDSSLNYKRNEIYRAVDIINQETNSAFVEREPRQGVYSVRFVGGNGCSSHVGRVFVNQPITLAPGCPVHSIIHEMMHAVGIYHEQTRPDRDGYVTIYSQNIVQGFFGANFAKLNSNNCDITPSPYSAYDFSSIMHYAAYDFSKNGQPTITTRNGEQIGLDIMTLLDKKTVDYSLLDCGVTQPIAPVCGDLCVPMCRNGGVCNDGICDCRGTGYKGESCIIPGEPDPEPKVCDCINDGICIERTGDCDCSGTGFTGENCQIPLCSQECQNGGVCINKDECDCSATGYNGRWCDIKDCDQECKNGGICRNGVCDCRKTNFSGLTCEVPILDPSLCKTSKKNSCINGGKCERQAVWPECRDTIGAKCESDEQCVMYSSIWSECLDEGYCKIKYWSESCNLNTKGGCCKLTGFVKPDIESKEVCICPENFEGEFCEQSPDPDPEPSPNENIRDCSSGNFNDRYCCESDIDCNYENNGGVCSITEPKCNCNDGFYGTECRECPDCGNHGKCDQWSFGTGNCICDTGFTGVGCDTCIFGHFGSSCLECSVCSKTVSDYTLKPQDLPPGIVDDPDTCDFHFEEEPIVSTQLVPLKTPVYIIYSLLVMSIIISLMTIVSHVFPGKLDKNIKYKVNIDEEQYGK